MFLHDQGDTKQSWQLNSEWEPLVSSNKGPANIVKTDIGNGDDNGHEAMINKIPFVCAICE
jgi:hypothetical protein